jgi:hypothetical protein
MCIVSPLSLSLGTEAHLVRAARTVAELYKYVRLGCAVLEVVEQLCV